MSSEEAFSINLILLFFAVKDLVVDYIETGLPNKQIAFNGSVSFSIFSVNYNLR